MTSRGVAVAVEAQLDQPLDVARGGALAPELAARARPVGDVAGPERCGEAGGVHPGEHQHRAVAGLGDGRDQAVRVEPEARDVEVLFLFVVMMLDVDFAELAGFIKHAPLGALVGLILFVELVLVLGFTVIKPGALAAPSAPIPTPPGSGITNTEALGRRALQYVYFFQGAGLILLVAMIGAIVLTLRHKEGVKRQSIAAQVARGKKTAMDVVKVPSGAAIIPAADRRGRRQGKRPDAHHRPWALPYSCRDPVHARHLRHLPQPQECHRHPDVDRADAAGRQHQPALPSSFMGDLVGQVFALFVLTVAAGEAAIGLAIVVVYYRNRGSIAVEDINLMKG